VFAVGVITVEGRRVRPPCEHGEDGFVDAPDRLDGGEAVERLEA
jgi:hypothetical protein